MKASASIVLSIVTVVAAISNLSMAEASPIFKDPTASVMTFLKKDAEFFDSITRSALALSDDKRSTSFSSNLATMGHLADSIKRSRRKIIMAAIRNWDQVDEPELMVRLDDALADAFSVADSKLVSMVKLRDDKITSLSYPRTIVKYLNSQTGPECLLNN